MARFKNEERYQFICDLGLYDQSEPSLNSAAEFPVLALIFEVVLDIIYLAFD